MDSLFHFVFPLIIALAARVHLKHGLLWVLGLSLAAVLLDLDVFFVHRATLHNLFVTLLLPAILVAFAFQYEKRGNKYKTLSLLLLLFLLSHTILDMGTESGVQLLYPFTDQVYQFSGGVSVGLPIGSGYLVSGLGISLLLYLFLLILVLFVEDFVKYFERDRNVERALKDTIKKEEKKLKKEL
jgi:membrane-bound metal-dependent hydrolase YbcI (DUF457 family)